MPSASEIQSDPKPADFRYGGADLEAMAFADNYHRWILNEFHPFIGSRVAEVGAGCGNFSKLLLERELESLHSFEPSHAMFSLMEQRLKPWEKLTPMNNYLGERSGEFASRFDTVIYNNVMEHVEHDALEVRTVYKTLKPHGCILIFVPALSWLYSDFDRSLDHFRRYNKSSGIKLLEDAGFTVVKAKYMDFVGVFPWLIFMKLMKQHLSQGKVSLYDKYAIPFNRFVESILTPPIGKNLLLVGRKA